MKSIEPCGRRSWAKGSTLLVAVLFRPDVLDPMAWIPFRQDVWTTWCKEPFTHHVDVESNQVWTCLKTGLFRQRGTDGELHHGLDPGR